MATWPGWEPDLLRAAQIANSANRRKFLDDWHAHADSDCRNNPVDLTVQSAGSSDCASLPAIGARAQNYTTTGNAGHAFFAQLHSGRFPALLHALQSTNPYTVTNTGTVAEELSLWGSQTFSGIYFTETANAPGRGGGPVGAKAPHAHQGWHALRRSVNTNLPAALRDSEKAVRRARQALTHARKVRL